MAGTHALISIPDRAWRSGAAGSAVHRRDVAAIIRLAQRHTGASQHRLASAVGIPQGLFSEILKATRTVTALEVFKRIADGLTTPGHARIAMGPAPDRPGHTADLAPSLGEVVDMFSNQADASQHIRVIARHTTHVQVLAVRGLWLVGLEDALLQGVLARSDPPATVTVLLSDADAASAGQRAAEVGESAESFASGIRLSVARLAELRHPQLAVYLYSALPSGASSRSTTRSTCPRFAHCEGNESPAYKIVNTSSGALYHGFTRTPGDMRDHAKRVV